MNDAHVPFHVKGWCPGALAPMPTGDGLLVRIRATGGRLSPLQGQAIASLSRRFGNGIIDLSQRANLQLRGVQEHQLSELHFELRALWLLDTDPSVEAIRNVVASPLSGLDPQAEIDGTLIDGALEAALVADPELRALPGKFGFSVDDGGRIGLQDVSVDVRLIGWQGRVIIALSGEADQAAIVDLQDAVPAAVAVARTFLRLAASITPPARRMRTLVAAIGAERILTEAGFDQLFPADELPPRRTHASELIGAFPAFVGVAAPFGRLTADQMELLADVAMLDLRLTPWRLVLLPGASAEDLERLRQGGLIVEPADPRLGITACPGLPSCSSAEVDTRLAAERLARLSPPVQAENWLHLSGCGKGCASMAEHPVTLVGRRGRFDLIVDGRPDGKVLRHDLTLAEVEDMLSSETTFDDITALETLDR
ncbi:precorrin-3B synthase [Oryzibacter oryziterrae]|uniref:precorrin-3B synthase n=1 Tax=Oryzibacter oryziterrae TaxID=2766474 RepID=UPI001F02EE90|nr:precorrin-3B synthase [Oryzibacter oryziterrae]